jgi:chemotaxis protein CheX
MLEAEITEIARDLWLTMFGIELVAGTEDAPSGPTVTAVVHISGEWDGAVKLRCSSELARSLSERLLGVSDDAEVRDLVGELANQLGGNLKALLPSPSGLSLPAVAMGDDYNVRVTDTDVAARVRLSCDGDPVIITLLERS